ncbi:hypothetical protein BGZ65_007628 [Modicella reniformis]|uniref:SH3 domain-containing protein n=1 Tax=Modicella reniformis TaxID=1440133 RepID=A0A9P6MB37_9FUNG|nr:hypothetical protein BGZ65_007628 [Modicella reniformis]
MVQVTQAKALFDCVGDEESELTFRQGDLLVDVRETSEDGWLFGRLERTGEGGLFPDNYVKLIYIDVEPSKPSFLPQLPARSSVTAKGAPLPHQLNTTPEQPINTTTTKPPLPDRKDQTSPAPGLRSTMRSRTESAPPALPKRSNAVNEKESATNELTATLALSVRERMANLSTSSQRQLNSLSSTTVGLQPGALPPRPTGRDLAQGSSTHAASSPPSSSLKPALPPRARAQSTIESSSLPTSSLLTASTSGRVYQVEDAAVPVPKLTTFARPRSARTSKGPGSPTQNERPSTISLMASHTEATSTPPKLPSRTSTLAKSRTNSDDSSADKSANTSSSSGPVRFSPVAVRQNPSELSALPAISRNPQPLPLPSRANLNLRLQGLPGAVLAEGLKDVDSDQKNDGSSSDASSGPLGSAFGVKLNSVGSKALKEALLTSTIAPAASEANKDKAPPLPTRTSTIPATLPNQREGPTTPSMRSQRESNSNLFSPPSSTMGTVDTMGHSWSTQSSPSKGVTRSHVTISPSQAPEGVVSEAIGVKPDARRRYEALFKTMSSGAYIEGTQVHVIYVRSRLDSKALAQIWDLVDVDNAGRLSEAQFCMGLYLIDERLASGLIPLEVSDELLLLRSGRGMITSLLARHQQPVPAVRLSNAVVVRVQAQRQQQQARTFITPPQTTTFASNSANVEKGVQNITDLFMTARDELEYAEEARGTVYYNDDKETAREAVQECLNTYSELLKDLDEAQKLDVQRKIGLKIMELKSQLDALNAEELE